MFKNIKRLAGFIGEYKKASILSPVIVALEVVMECLIPFFTADLITYVETGDKSQLLTKGIVTFVENNISTNSLAVTGFYCGILIIMALCSLSFGALAGIYCSTASCGFA